MDILDAITSDKKSEAVPVLFPFEGERGISVSLPLKKWILCCRRSFAAESGFTGGTSIEAVRIPGFEMLSQNLIIFDIPSTVFGLRSITASVSTTFSFLHSLKLLKQN